MHLCGRDLYLGVGLRARCLHRQLHPPDSLSTAPIWRSLGAVTMHAKSTARLAGVHWPSVRSAVENGSKPRFRWDTERPSACNCMVSALYARVIQPLASRAQLAVCCGSTGSLSQEFKELTKHHTCTCHDPLPLCADPHRPSPC